MAVPPNLRRRGTNTVPATLESADQAPGSLSEVHAEPGRPNPYPHRLSVDVDADTYRALRLIAAHEQCRLVDVVRAGIAHEIAARQ